MFRNFSSQYYIRPYWVVEEKNGLNRINKTEYNLICNNITNEPVIMKVGSTHFEVIGDENIPEQTMYVSSSIVSSVSDSDRVPGEFPVLLAKNNNIV